MTNHLMIDLETMGTGADAVVLRMAWLFFDPSSGQAPSKSAPHGDVPLWAWQQICQGRRVDPGTQDFWLRQEPKLRSRMLNGGEGETSMPAEDAIQALAEAVEQHLGEGCGVWSRGDLDRAQLASLFKQYGIERPWVYWQERDVRTLTKAVPATYATHDTLNASLHDPLADCLVQATQVWQAFTWMALAEEAM